MPRWSPPNQKMILQQIADDEHRPANEREAARRELAAADQPQRQSRRPMRDVPITQQDQDSDIENWFKRGPRDDLTSHERAEIFKSLDDSTQLIIDAIENPILALYVNNETEITLLIQTYRQTQSEFVRKKAMGAITAISKYSTVQAARDKANEFINQLDSNRGQSH
jgi:hypothetical protein